MTRLTILSSISFSFLAVTILGYLNLGLDLSLNYWSDWGHVATLVIATSIVSVSILLFISAIRKLRSATAR